MSLRRRTRSAEDSGSDSGISSIPGSETPEQAKDVGDLASEVSNSVETLKHKIKKVRLPVRSIRACRLTWFGTFPATYATFLLYSSIFVPFGDIL